MVRRVLPLILALLAGCASAPPLQIPMPVTVKEPVYVPVYCPAPRLAPPTMPVAALAPDAPPADTIRAYAATVMTLKGAVTERDAIIAGCAAPTGANSAGGSGEQATAAVGNAAAGAQAASGAPGLQNNERQAGRMKWLHDALTGKGNLTFDAARILGVIGAAANVGLWAAAGT